MAEPRDPPSMPGVTLKNVPWWVLPFLAGVAGGGAGGTAISRPVFASTAPSLTKDDVVQIVDDRITKNNAYLLQQIDLLLTKDKLERATEKETAHAP